MHKKRPAAGFFDQQDRHAKLAKLNDVLIRLKAQVDWDGFRAVVEEAFPVRDPRKGGHPPYDRLMLFKMLVLCRLYHLSAEALEYQVNDRRSFQDFLDLVSARQGHFHLESGHHGKVWRHPVPRGE